MHEKTDLVHEKLKLSLSKNQMVPLLLRRLQQSLYSLVERDAFHVAGIIKPSSDIYVDFNSK